MKSWNGLRVGAAVAVVCLLMLGVAPAVSQTVPSGYVLVSGANTADASGNVVQNGTISFRPVNNLGSSISFRAAGGTAARTTAVFGVTIGAQTPGSGYSSSWTCAVNGGTYSSQATCTATVTSGGLVFAITSAGSYTVGPTSITYSGGTYAAGAPATATAGLTLSGTLVSAGGSGYVATAATFPGCTGSITSAVTVTSGAVSAVTASGGSCPSGTAVAIAGAGQAGPNAVTAQVTNGAFSILLADSVAATPANVCYSVTILDNVSSASLLGPGYTCVQPAGSGAAISGGSAWCAAGSSGAGGKCNFDLYTPNLTAGVLTQAGPQGPTGAAGPDCSVSSPSGQCVVNALLSGAGMQDSLVKQPLDTLFCGSGASDEGTATDNCIAADIAATVRGRVYSPSTNGSAVTWVVNPFAALSVSSGQPTEYGSYQLKLPPNLTVTADQEVDLGFDSTLDCGNGYAGGTGVGYGTYIIPEASGFPTSTLIGLGTLATNSTAIAVQGAKLLNCGLSANGVTGLTAVDESQNQEGSKAVNNRMFGFQVCFNAGNTAVDGGNFHFWGNFDNQCEMEDDTDSTIWGARYGYQNGGAESGIIQNFSTIGGSNPNGTTKIGVENDGSGLVVDSLTEEGLTYGVLYNAFHGGDKDNNLYIDIGCSSAGHTTSICAEDDNIGTDSGSIWMGVAGNSSNTNFLQLNEPSAVIRQLHGDPALGFYAYDAGANVGQATVLTNSPQIANSNLKFGDSYSNAAAWPALDLPAKTVSMTISGSTFMGDEYMTTADHSGGVLPEGLATNGDSYVQGSLTPHSMALTREGPGNCISTNATTAGDYMVTSSTAWNSTSAVACTDTGAATIPVGTPYIGKVQKSVASAPSAPTAPTVTTNCTGTCATSYAYKWVAMASIDPLDHTQSAGSTAGTVSSAAVLTSSTTNTISGCSTGTASTPCELFETTGPNVGWLVETANTSSVIDNGMIGTRAGVGFGSPLTVGIIDPPVHVELGQSGAALATSSTVGVVQPDNTTITVNGSGVISTAAGSRMPYYSNGQGNTAGLSFSPTANSQYAFLYPITAQVQFNEMCISINTDDTGGGLYALALVKLTSPTCTGASCATTTEAHWSAQTISATGTFCAANAEGNVSVTPGLYYLVTTGSATTAKWAAYTGTGQQFTNLVNAGAGTSASGVLGTITLDVMANGVQVIGGAGGPISLALTQ